MNARIKYLLGRGFLVLLIFLTCAAPSAAAVRFPPVVQPKNNLQLEGKAIFFELVTPDLAAAKKFYGSLFGWTFRDIRIKGKKGVRNYAEALLDGHPVAGLFQRKLPAGERRRPAWLTFFSVSNADAAKKTAVQNGAKLLFGPRDIPGRGQEAVFSDPQGAVFAVLASSSGDPPDVLASPGEWIWSSLITTDPDTDAAFYQKLFGYEVFRLPSGRGAQHLLLASENYARASVNSIPAKRPGLHPHWLNFVRVVDAEKTAARVAALGGRILVAPHADRQGGKIAVVADPAGAVFGLLEWPGAKDMEAPR